MLQEQYDKHNLQMQPYHHYLAEYQSMDPADISRHLGIPYDENTGLFQVKFMEKNYTVSYPKQEIHCLDKEDAQAVLCHDIHAKNTGAAVFYRRGPYGGYGESAFLSGSSLGRGVLPSVLWEMYHEAGKDVWKQAGYLSGDYERIKRKEKGIRRHSL